MSDLRDRMDEVRDVLWILQRQENHSADSYWGKDRALYDECLTSAVTLGTAISLIDEALDPSSDYVDD